MKCAAMTLGSHGALARMDGKFVYSPAFVVNCVDTTGAGDVFHGAFCYAVLKGMGMRETLEFANAMAALNCTKLGARGGIATAAEARALIERGERRANKDFARRISSTPHDSASIDGAGLLNRGSHGISDRHQYLIFLYQATLSPARLNTFVRQWGIVPDQMRGIGLVPVHLHVPARRVAAPDRQHAVSVGVRPQHGRSDRRSALPGVLSARAESPPESCTSSSTPIRACQPSEPAAPSRP